MSGIAGVVGQVIERVGRLVVYTSKKRSSVWLFFRVSLMSLLILFNMRWSSFSLFKHIDELKLFLADSTIDILAINETKIDPLIKISVISILGFDVVRKDRSMNGRFAGGGVCLYINTNIYYKIRLISVMIVLKC